MGEEIPDVMNLDLNLGPVPEAGSGSISTEAVNLDEWSDNRIDRLREAFRRRRWRRQQVHIPPVARNISLELDQSLGNLGNISTLQAGEGSVAAEERINDVPKMCENSNGFLEDNVSEKKDDIEKGSSNDGSFFDCNVCLDLARDPVVTCCGHLFCWSCLYRWLNVHSYAKECPVCKGEVTNKTVTPIFGRGNATGGVEDDSGLKIPPRPDARRVESLRQMHRSSFSFPVEEMIRLMGSRFMARDLTPPRDGNVVQETAERTNSFLNRIMTSRGIRSEQNSDVPLVEVNFTPSSTAGPEATYTSSLLPRQAQLRRAARIPSSSERYFEAYIRAQSMGRNQEQAPPVDDRDSVSSIAAVINSESQIDTAVEIDSGISLSTSTSRRRNEPSRVSDVDSGDSRPPRRRRLN
ncbi:hypothetical protein SLEP1_g42901 [Rubroshorea leprosula]|uniref:E3 ubiquitin-protein ligase RMA n=1 Tax=Rubroshorea leprosula TaxID=152421 RepID=A0AAV5LBQ1_9ROSI|nr:hypothetical protein SLEP1_g42901 [Rubroshorea leprosula]